MKKPPNLDANNFSEKFYVQNNFWFDSMLYFLVCKTLNHFFECKFKIPS